MKQQVQIGLALLAIAVFAVLAPFNHGSVTLRVWPDIQWKLPLLLFLAVAFLGGAIFVIVVGWAGKVADAVDRRFFRWEPRARRLARAFLKKGYGAMEKGEEQSAHRHFLKAQRLDPRFDDSYRAMAQWFERNENPKEALIEIRKAHSLRPDDPVLLEMLAKYALAADDPGRAADALISLKELRPESRYALKMLPTALAGAGRWEEAHEAQKKYVYSLPKEERQEALETLMGIKTELAGAVRAAGPARAKKLLKEVLKQSPDFVPGAVLFSELAVSSGKPDEARRALIDAFRAKPEVELYERLSRVDLGYEEAEEIAASALEMNPRHHALRFARARQRLLRGQMESAREELEKISGEPDPLKQMLLAIAMRQIAPESADEVEKSALRSITIEHYCSICGYHANEWKSRCPDCGRWNKMVSAPVKN